MKATTIVSLSPTLLLMACLLASSPATADEPEPLDEPRATPSPVSLLDRKIEPSDILYIEVFNEINLTVERRVQADGTISYPYLGSLDAAGKTANEVAQVLTRKLGADYLVHPEVTVMIKEYRTSTVSVMGKVNRPGPVQLPPEHRMDLLEAIAMAGDLQRGANQNRIEHTRNGKTTRYRFNDLKRDPTKRIMLEPGDLIYVHERFL